MKNLLILGLGTAGTMVANRLQRRLPTDWQLTAVDPDVSHVYQPGLLFLPFGARDEAKITRPRARTLRADVPWVRQAVERVEPDAHRVVLKDGETLAFDLLVIASGARLRPAETPGLADALDERSVHDFYTLEGAQALRCALERFDGGRFVVNVVEMPIKCPVAAMELLFLADEYFVRRGIRERVDLVYATPLDGAFTKPMCNKVLGYLIREQGHPDRDRVLDRRGGRRGPPPRLLRRARGFVRPAPVSIPVHGGAEFVEKSGMGNELGFVPTHPHTLRAKGHPDVFVLGDATDLPSSKAGSVAHFQAEVLEENLLRAMAGRSLEEGFDGHANCFIETGFGRSTGRSSPSAARTRRARASPRACAASPSSPASE